MTPRTCISLERSRTRSTSAREHGGVLIEFAISITVLWLLVAATLDLGRAFAASQLLQTAARAAARELALDDRAAWDAPFEDGLSAIYDPAYLVVDAACLGRQAVAAERSAGEELERLLDGRMLNRMLRGLMIFERVRIDGEEREFLRYPGALLEASSSADPGKPCTTRFTVGVPEVDEANTRIVMHSVVEEAEPGDYSLAGAGTGTVGLRILFPFQAAALSDWRVVDGVSKPVLASETDGYSLDTSGVEGAEILPELDARGPDGSLQAYAQRQSGETIPVYGGRLGLGVQGVLGREVRPYRRVLQAQAFAPREVFGGMP